MDQHGTVQRAFSVVELWRLRRVRRAFHRWGTAALAALPRLAVVGGTVAGRGTASVEVLDLSTFRWSSGVVPDLPSPRGWHGACSFGDGQVVVAGGWGEHARTALQWERGGTDWTDLPDLVEGRAGAASTALPDGRAMVIGGFANQRPLASVEVLSADGSGWSALTPMSTARSGAAAAVLPCGKVLVAGGQTSRQADSVVNTAELWDPVTGAWSDLPPMAEARRSAGCCVLPSGRVAVVGGMGSDYQLRRDGEAFDPVAQTWQPLPAMAHVHSQLGVVAVAGGLLAVGGTLFDAVPAELFDEASGRWFELPHPMAQPRQQACVVSLPAAALAPPAAAGAAAAAAP